jgi:hypothetical protein
MTGYGIASRAWLAGRVLGQWLRTRRTRRVWDHDPLFPGGRGRPNFLRPPRCGPAFICNNSGTLAVECFPFAPRCQGQFWQKAHRECRAPQKVAEYRIFCRNRGPKPIRYTDCKASFRNQLLVCVVLILIHTAAPDGLFRQGLYFRRARCGFFHSDRLH